MRIHKEGNKLIVVLAIISIAIYYLLRLTETPEMVLYPVVGLLLFLNIFNLSFFRIPTKRVETHDAQKVVAPADGKVVLIEEVQEDEYFQDKRLMVSIFMSPLNVHCNYFPFPGKVDYAKYHKGKYLVAWHPKSSTLNERTSTVLEHANGTKVLIRQIAGALARRISLYSKEGMEVKQNQELGFIKYGSRVDLYFPLGTKINVEIDQITKGRQTVVAEL